MWARRQTDITCGAWNTSRTALHAFRKRPLQTKITMSWGLPWYWATQLAISLPAGIRNISLTHRGYQEITYLSAVTKYYRAENTTGSFLPAGFHGTVLRSAFISWLDTTGYNIPGIQGWVLKYISVCKAFFLSHFIAAKYTLSPCMYLLPLLKDRLECLQDLHNKPITPHPSQEGLPSLCSNFTAYCSPKRRKHHNGLIPARVAILDSFIHNQAHLAW